MDLLKVHADNFESKTSFKTILLDDTMTIENLVATSMKRFGFDKENPEKYYISLALGEKLGMRPDKNELVKTAFSKYISAIDQGTARVYLSRMNLPSRSETKTHARTSIEAQKRLFSRVNLLGSASGSKSDTMTLKEFNEALDGLFNGGKYTQAISQGLKNIQSYQSLYSENESNHKMKGKMRTKEQYEEALLNSYDKLSEDIKEDFELIKVLQKNVEAILLISLKMCAE